MTKTNDSHLTPAATLRHRQAANVTIQLREALRDLMVAANAHLDTMPVTTLRFDELDEAVEVTRRCRETAAFLRGES